MFFTCKLSFLTLWRSPGRLILTGLAMIAAAAVVTWMVSGYDAILAEVHDDDDDLLGDYDLLALLPVNQPPTLPPDLVERLAADPAVQDIAAMVAIDVTTQLAARPENRRPGGGSRGGRGAAAGSPAARPTAAASESLPPPTYGLPRRGPALIGTTATTPPRPLTSGAWLPPADGQVHSVARRPAPKPIACVLPDRLAKQAGLRPGDSFPVGSLAGTFTMTVMGTVADAPDLPLLSRQNRKGEKTHPAPGNGILVRWSDAEQVAGGPLTPACLALKLRPPADLNTVLQSAGAGWANDVVWVTAADLAAARQASNTVNFQKMQAYSATGLAMLVSFVIIFASLGMGIDERVRQLAVLRTVALTRLQTAASVLIEAVLLGVIGWTGGLASGRIMLAILPTVSESAASRVADARIGVWTIGLTGLCAVVGALVAALYPAWRATRIRPLDAMAPLTVTERPRIPPGMILAALPLLLVNPAVVFLPRLPELVRIRLYAFLGCPAMALGFVLLAPTICSGCRLLLQGVMSRLLGLEPHFLQSQLDANLWRAAGIVTALSIGLGLYMTTLIWSASMLMPFLPGAWMPDAFVAIMPGGITAASLPEVRRIPGLQSTACLPVAVEQVRLAADLTDSAARQSVIRQDNVVVLGVDPAAGLAGLEPLLPFAFSPASDRDRALTELSAHSNACLIPAHFALAASLTVGDDFAVLPPNRPDQPVALHVAGIIELKGWHWFSKFAGIRRNASRTAAMIFTSEQATRRLFDLDRVNYLWFNLEPGADITAVTDALQALADRHRGESYRIPDRGQAVITRQHLQMTVTSELHRSIHNRTDTMVAGMLKMPFLILLVTSFAVANTAVAALRARRREIGIMRAVGLSGAGLMRLILAEAVIIALTAGVVSLAFGLFAGVCSAQMSTHLSFFGGMGWNFAVPWTDLANGFAITLLICLAAAVPVAIAAGCRKPLGLIE